MKPSSCAVLIAALAILAAAHAAPQAFQKIEACRWKANRWNDGDRFHIAVGDAGREIVARLYFVDAPEAETAWQDRLDEQSAYFGISRGQRHDWAQFSLGLCYRNGTGFERDPAQAYRWLQLAADLGHEKASQKLASLVGVMSPSECEAGQQLYKEGKTSHER